MHVSCTLKKTDPQVQIKAMCRFHPSPSSNRSRAGAITSHPPQTGSSVWKTTLLPLQTREHVCPHVIQLPFLHVEWTQPLNRWRQGPGLSMQCETDTHDMDITHMCIKHRRVFSGKHIRTVQQSAYTVRSGSVSTWTVLTPKTLLSYLWVTLTCFERSEMWCKFANREKKKSPICYSSINIWFYLNPDVSEYICFLWILIFKSLKYLKTICMLFLELWWWHVQTGTSFS